MQNGDFSEQTNEERRKRNFTGEEPNIKGGQRTMFQPAILTVQSVFKKLREIADISGGSIGS